MAELLVVMAIIAVLMTLVVPAVGSMLRSSQLTQGTIFLSAKLDLARQNALARNHSIEVRFYRYADPSQGGEIPSNPTTGKYRAMQLFEVSETGKLTALTKVETLPPAVIADAGSKLSSILGTASTGALAPVTTTGQTLQTPIPAASTNYTAVSFRFLPDGSTNLPGSGKWFLTLHGLLDGDALANAPKNFATIQIDASNGHLRTFRP